MLFFSLPKLAAQEPSVKGFTQFVEALPVDPYLFMYVTGAVELSIVALLITGLVAEMKNIAGYSEIYLTVSLWNAALYNVCCFTDRIFCTARSRIYACYCCPDTHCWIRDWYLSQKRSACKQRRLNCDCYC